MPHFQAPFKVETFSVLGELKLGRLVIPELQRPFAWRVEQAQELVGDLEILMAAREAGLANPKHFFGSIVLLDRGFNVSEVIDGQQRLTTVSILLGLIEAEAEKVAAQVRTAQTACEGEERAVLLEAEAECRRIASAVHEGLWVTEGIGRGNARGEALRLSVSPEIRQTFEAIVTGMDSRIESERTAPARHLREIAQYFAEHLFRPWQVDQQDLHERLRRLQAIRQSTADDLVVVEMRTGVASAGYELFQSLNARGLPLNVLDLLKVWILATFAEHSAGSAADQVTATFRALARFEVEKQLAFFDDFYRARTGHQPPRSAVYGANHYAARSRALIFEDPLLCEGKDPEGLPERVTREVHLMERWQPSWYRLKGYDSVRRRLPAHFEGAPNAEWVSNRLELLLGANGHQAGYPLLMVAADAARDTPEVFAGLVHSIERFFFRYKSVCGGPESSIVAAYREILIDIEQSGEVRLSFANEQLSRLMGEHASDQRFKSMLVDRLNYGNSRDRSRIRYFFDMLDEYSYATKPFRRQGPLDLASWHIEHIVPQRPQQGDPGLPEEQVNLIGNLCLLPPSINNKLSNLSFAEKCRKARDLRSEGTNIGPADAANLFYSSSSSEWTSDDVESRIEFLTDVACRVVFPVSLA